MKTVTTLIVLAGVSYAAGVGGTFRYSFVSPNLYCLDFGFYDAACVSGITGFDLNPAGLSQMKGGSFATAVSSTKRTDARIDLQLVDSTFSFGTVVIPVRVRFEEVGGWDFLGEGVKIGPFALGFGFRRGEKVGVDPLIDTVVARRWDQTIPIDVNNALIPQIPAWVGTIPVVISVTGDGRLGFDIRGSSYVTYTPITVGTALDLGKTSFGLGATVNLFQGKAELVGQGGGSFSNVLGRITASSGQTPWTVDITFRGSASDDSVYQEDFKGDLVGRQFVLRAGNLTKVTNLIAGELLLGTVVEEVFPATIGTGFTNRFSYASGLPTTILFDTTTASITVDSVNHRITGTIDVTLSDFSRSTELDSAAYPFQFYPQTNLYFSSLYRIGKWDFNLGAGLVGFLPVGPGWGRMYFDIGIKLHAALDWRLGVVTALQRYQVSKYSVITPPIVAAGFGVGAKFYGVGIDLCLSSNISQAILQAISASHQVQIVNYNRLNWIGFGFGLKYDF